MTVSLDGVLPSASPAAMVALPLRVKLLDWVVLLVKTKAVGLPLNPETQVF